MKKINLLMSFLATVFAVNAQLDTLSSPEVYIWLQDTVTTGSYYMEGNSTTISNNTLVNCQRVEYSDDFVYVTATGVPSYPTGPFLDRNPSQAENQDGIYQIPRKPAQNTGTPTATRGGNIGIFINGVALFDFRDGVAWDSSTGALCGGPGNPRCSGAPGTVQDWNRDAIPAEREGFDCAKGHPAMGNYHHHQNPSAFDLDLDVVSDVCNLYDADGLYKLDSTSHSPLIGYAYDGFPIYGAYGYKNTDGTGGIVRVRSGYQLRNITTRTTSPSGASVGSGPDVDATYFLGYFREDYVWSSNASTEYLDEHNGRFGVTPEYPNGTYAYFATVDENWNSAYPYVVGPTFYGDYADRSVTTINESTTRFIPSKTGITDLDFEKLKISIFPNPSTDLIAIQLGNLVKEDVSIELIDISGKLVASTRVPKGSSVTYFDVQTVYAGTYIIQFSTRSGAKYSKKVIIAKD